MTDDDHEMMFDCAVILACSIVLCWCAWAANWWLGWGLTSLFAALGLAAAIKRFQELDKRGGGES